MRDTTARMHRSPHGSRGYGALLRHAQRGEFCGLAERGDTRWYLFRTASPANPVFNRWVTYHRNGCGAIISVQGDVASLRLFPAGVPHLLDSAWDGIESRASVVYASREAMR